jgi:hypothetical protein
MNLSLNPELCFSPHGDALAELDSTISPHLLAAVALSLGEDIDDFRLKADSLGQICAQQVYWDYLARVPHIIIDEGHAGAGATGSEQLSVDKSELSEVLVQHSKDASVVYFALL